jgi:type VI secretion system protein ImpL
VESPIRKLLNELFEQTNWDNPSLLNERLGQAQAGVLEWIKQSILRMGPSRVEMDVKVGSEKEARIPMGPIGKEFASLARIMMARNENPALISDYLKSLSKLRSRFNEIKNQGDPGPGARAMMVSTLGGSASELGDSLKYVDEQMLVGMTDSARAALRPLLVRPLMQAMTVVVPPAETEINRIWAAQVSEPFQRTLAAKYPFDKASRVEAGPAEIGKIFGPEGAIAKFGTDTLGPLVVRRGDTITARTWADIGARLRPEFSDNFGTWVAQLEGAAANGGGGAAGGGVAGGPGAVAQPSADQTLFQLLPQGSPGISEYSITIDGQTLRYRNNAPEWVSMLWPNASGVAGVRITAITNDGQAIEFINEPGANGLKRLFDSAQVRKIENRLNEMTWTNGPHRVVVQLRVVRTPGELAPAGKPANPGGGGGAAAILPSMGRLQGLRLPTLVVGVDGPPGKADSAPSASAPASAGAGASGAAR